MNFEMPYSEESNESIESLRLELEKLYEDNFLIAHQTHNHSAEKINSDPYFSESGLVGTALMVSIDDVIRVLPELDKPVIERKILTHKGANSLVIMTFPKQLIPQVKKNLNVIDDLLVDFAMDGKIKKFGLPNQHVFGYYADGNFHKNPNFDSDFLNQL